MPVSNTIHASTIVLGHLGILIRGASGSGKSRLAHGLIERFQQERQFAIWVSDDRTILEFNANKVIAHCPDAIAGIAERRFAGLAKVDHQSSCILDLVVDLVSADSLERLPEEKPICLTEDSEPITAIQVPNRDVPLAIELVLAHVTKLLAQKR